MTDHPITPPPELVEQWLESTRSHDCIGAYPTDFERRICTAAARWGADQELEACCQWQDIFNYQNAGNLLRAARRPKPPSLKQKGLNSLAQLEAQGLCPELVSEVRQCLEALPE